MTTKEELEKVGRAEKDWFKQEEIPELIKVKRWSANNCRRNGVN